METTKVRKLNIYLKVWNISPVLKYFVCVKLWSKLFKIQEQNSDLKFNVIVAFMKGASQFPSEIVFHIARLAVIVTLYDITCLC